MQKPLRRATIITIIMFKNLYRKIYYPFFFLTVALILFIDVFAAVVQINALNDTYISMGEKKLTRIMNSCKLYLSSAETTTYNLSLDETLVDELSAPSGESLMPILEDACNYSLKINAITAYSHTGAIFTSAAVGDVPPLDKLRQDQGIAGFLDGGGDGYISVRTRYMAGIYGNSRYDETMGVITCCRKVYKDGVAVGVIFTDILPSNLYAYVYGEGQFEDATSFISFDGGYFKYGDNDLKENLLTSDGHYGYFRHSAKSDDKLYTLTVFDGKSEFYSHTAIIMSIMVVASVILVIAVHFGARAIARSVTVRLDKFLDKMNSQQLP